MQKSLDPEHSCSSGLRPPSPVGRRKNQLNFSANQVDLSFDGHRAWAQIGNGGHKTLAMLKRYYHHPRAADLAKKLG